MVLEKNSHLKFLFCKRKQSFPLNLDFSMNFGQPNLLGDAPILMELWLQIMNMTIISQMDYKHQQKH